MDKTTAELLAIFDTDIPGALDSLAKHAEGLKDTPTSEVTPEMLYPMVSLCFGLSSKFSQAGSTLKTWADGFEKPDSE